MDRKGALQVLEYPPLAMTESSMVNLVALLLLAVTVAVITKKIRVPYTVALVLVGVAAGALWKGDSIDLDRELILLIFLPPLLFEGCLNMDLEILRRNALPVFLLALPAVILTVVGLGALIHVLLVDDLLLALLVAAIIAPTDPVSVLAIFRELGVGRDLSVTVEGESVFNDGIGVVLVLILADAVTGGTGGEGVGLGDGVVRFLMEVGIGLAVGLVLGGAAYLILSWVDDHLVEVVLSLILAYGSYLAADQLHGSGVISVVAAGLIMGNFGRILAMSPTTRITLSAFWDVAAFLANSLIFLLIGTHTHPEKYELGGESAAAVVDKAEKAAETFSGLPGGDVPGGAVEGGKTLIEGDIRMWAAVLIVFLLLLALRGVIVYGLMTACRWLQGRPPVRWIFVVFWGGLRGAIPIALVLGLHDHLEAGIAEEAKHLVLGVVLLSLVVQGLSMRFILRGLGLGGPSEQERVLEETEGRAIAARAAERELEVMKKNGEIPLPLYEEIRVGLEEERKRAVRELRALVEEQPTLFGARRRHVWTRILKAQRVTLQAAVRRGVISEDVLHHLTGEIDARLSEGLPEMGEEEDPSPEGGDEVEEAPPDDPGIVPPGGS